MHIIFFDFYHFFETVFFIFFKKAVRGIIFHVEVRLFVLIVILGELISFL